MVRQAGNTFTVKVPVDEQPFASVTVTLIVIVGAGPDVKVTAGVPDVIDDPIEEVHA